MVALYIALVIMALIAVLAFIIPTPFTYEVERVINKPKAEVIDYLKYIKNQNEELVDPYSNRYETRIYRDGRDCGFYVWGMTGKSPRPFNIVSAMMKGG